MYTFAELAEMFETNAQTFTFLSQALFRELNDGAIAALAAQNWPHETGNDALDAGYAGLRRFFRFSTGDRRQQLAVEYACVFLAAGVHSTAQKSAVPYESVFTSAEHTLMGDSRDDVVRTFARDGFVVNPELHEPEDHLAFELEYVATMAVRAAALARTLAEAEAEAEPGESAGAADTETDAALRENAAHQAAFIRAHLLNWVPTLLDIARDFAKTTFYTGILNIIIGTCEDYVCVLDDIAS